MKFTPKQKREAYKKLVPEAQDFVMSDETTEIISNILNEIGLSEDQSIDADGEIFSSILGLQTLSDAISNIAQMSGKSVDELSELKEKLGEEIFSKIAEFESLSKETEPKEPENANEKPVLPQNKVGASFEQIILNQARAMQPARPAGEVPHNLPSEEAPSVQNEERKIHNYTAGNDPYREPIE